MSHFPTKEDYAFIKEYESHLHQAKINNCFPIPAFMLHAKAKLNYPKRFLAVNLSKYNELKKWVKNE